MSDKFFQRVEQWMLGIGARRGDNLAVFSSAGAKAGQAPVADGSGGVLWATPGTTGSSGFVAARADADVTADGVSGANPKFPHIEADTGHYMAQDGSKLTLPTGHYLFTLTIPLSAVSVDGEVSIYANIPGLTLFDQRVQVFAGRKAILSATRPVEMTETGELTWGIWNNTSAPISAPAAGCYVGIVKVA